MLLVINTAQKKYSVGLYLPPQKIQTLSWQSKKGSEDLLVKIDQILSQNKLTLKNIKAIIINQGPGSFTGLRVGISVVNVLSRFLEIPAIGIKNQTKFLKIAKMGYNKYIKNSFKKSARLLPYYGIGLK